MKLNKPVTIKFTFTPIKVATKCTRLLWALLPWIIIAILLSRQAGASPHDTHNDTKPSGSLTLPTTDPATTLLNQIKDAQKPPEPPPAPLPVIAPEPVLEPVHTPTANAYPYGQCTYWVKVKRPDIPNNLGNANNWYDELAAEGWAHGATPKAGAIGQSVVGMHVVYVESVNPDGTIQIFEGNYDYAGSTRERTANANEFVYIY